MAKLLLVDDSALILKMLEDWTKALGHTPIPVADGHFAESEFNTHRPDLVVLDYQLPNVSGTQVYQRIRNGEHGKRVPVIFLNGDTPSEFMFIVPEKNLLQFLPKPVNQDAFNKTVAEMLGASPAK